jgi:hypothetical protein
MTWWVYKCNSRNESYQKYTGDWRKFFDDPDQDWGDQDGTPELTELKEGDLVIAFQTNLNEIVGLAEVRQTTEKNGYLYLDPLEEIGIKVRPLKVDPKIKAIKAFQGGVIRTVYSITPEEAEYLLIAARHQRDSKPTGDQDETEEEDSEEGGDSSSTRIWFCNQSKQWGFEREHSVVCASDVAHALKYRSLLSNVRQGDLIVHYRSTKGFVAISSALNDARGPGRLPVPFRQHYLTGWIVKTEYHDLDPPVARNPVADALRDHPIPDGPFEKNGHVKQSGYFFRFDSTGLGVVRRAFRGTWPLLDGDSGNELEGRTEGGSRTVVQSVRSARLREDTKRRYGLKCYCCGFEFEEFYGEIARDRAIVHHLETFSGTDGSQRVSTVDDVRVVCANCHYVIHFEKKPIHVDDLKTMIAKNWTRWTNAGVARKLSSRNPRRTR